MKSATGPSKEKKKSFSIDFKVLEGEKSCMTKAVEQPQAYYFNNKPMLDEFLRFCQYQEKAVGLAANQVSVNGKRWKDRVCAVRDLKSGGWILMINPKIDSYFGSPQKKLEGCLSWPGKKVLADRYMRINICYFDINGQFQRGSITHFNAQVVQHELDHLNGVEETVVGSDYKIDKEKKIGRNDPCPCGSEVKYKYCCLK